MYQNAFARTRGAGWVTVDSRMTERRTDGDGARQLGRYQLVSLIASGGMAEIFIALMEGYAGSRRLCVIKKILPGIAGDKTAHGVGRHERFTKQESKKQTDDARGRPLTGDVELARVRRAGFR